MSKEIEKIARQFVNFQRTNHANAQDPDDLKKARDISDGTIIEAGKKGYPI